MLFPLFALKIASYIEQTCTVSYLKNAKGHIYTDSKLKNAKGHTYSVFFCYLSCFIYIFFFGQMKILAALVTMFFWLSTETMY